MPKMIDTELELRLQEFEPQQPADTAPAPFRIAFDEQFLRQSAHHQPAGAGCARRYRH